MLPLPIVAIAGIVVGWVSWVVAAALTPDAPPRSPADAKGRYALLLMSCVIMGSLVTISSIRSGGSLFATITLLLAAPLLVTLLTDIRARLVFPVVLGPGLLVALVLAAVGPGELPAALISGGAAAGVATLLVALSGWLWPNASETPLGSGEILIAATAGAMLGPDRTLIVLFAGMVLAAVVVGVLLLTRQVKGDEPIPYGACLCVAALVALAL